MNRIGIIPALSKVSKFTPTKNTDPLWLEFDEHNYIQDFCKTQFADIKIHIKIRSLLKALQPHFHKLFVNDEGEYWDTENRDLLQKHLNHCFLEIEDAKKENAALTGPFKLEDGRIIDLMES